MNRTPGKDEDGSFFKAMALCMFLKYAYTGFMYYPVLDDHIQYGVYKLYSPSYVFFSVGSISTRPAAAVLDYFLWSRLPLFVSVIIIYWLHFLSAVFIYKTLDYCEIKPSGWFFAIYLLLPTAGEGAFWLSAATRIICGMFFSGLAAWVLARDKKPFAVFLSLLSFAFYEQVAVFSFLLSAMVYIKNKKFPLALIINGGVLAAWYFAMQNVGSFDLRFDNSLSSLDVFRNITKIYGAPAAGLFANGFSRGVLLCMKKPLFFAGVLIAGYLAGKSAPGGTRSNLLILAGFILFLLPHLPFFISGGQWVSLRAGFVPAAGLAVMAGRIPPKKLQGAVLIVFLIINTAECRDYYMAGKEDQKIIEELAAREGEVFVVPRRPEASYHYHEHIESITASDWALQGAMHNKKKRPAPNYKVLREGEKPKDDTAEIFDAENFLWYIKD